MKKNIALIICIALLFIQGCTQGKTGNPIIRKLDINIVEKYKDTTKKDILIDLKEPNYIHKKDNLEIYEYEYIKSTYLPYFALIPIYGIIRNTDIRIQNIFFYIDKENHIIDIKYFEKKIKK